MLNDFKKDPYLFVKYYAMNFLLFILVDIWMVYQFLGKNELSALWFLAPLPLLIPNFYIIAAATAIFVCGVFLDGSQNFRFLYFSLIAVGIFVGTLSAATMHNAAHKNFRPKWINRIFGEICGVHQLGGYVGWTVTHLIHHSHPDDPVHDPHPPGHLSFPKYLLAMTDSLTKCINQSYLRLWGHNNIYRVTWRVVGVFIPVLRYLRAVFILCLLGPYLFILLYMVSYITLVFVYGHFNYYTHRPRDDNSIEVLNLDGSLYYKFMNRVFWGTYYHKSHHQYPGAFNPMRVKAGLGENPLITRQAH